MTRQAIRVEPAWEELLALLEGDHAWRSALVLGSTGSGKTTLCRFLGRELAKRWRVAAVDCDPGQAALGPPTCVSLAWEPWHGRRPVAMRFVGATSPSGHFLQALTGTVRLAERAFELGAQRVVLDSPGFMGSPAGREFHFQTLDVLEPENVIVLQQADEMEPLLAAFARRARMRIHRLRPSSAVVTRSREERRAYREERFAQYFRHAVIHALSLERIGLHGMVPPLGDEGLWRNLLVAPCDRRGFASALGILEGADLGRGMVTLYAPAFRHDRIASLQFGSIRLERSGRELV